MILVKQKTGSYLPAFQSDKDESDRVKIGESVTAKRSRNYEFHKKFMALINLCFANQDKYKNFEVFRKIMVINAGYYDEATDKNGRVVPIAHSISFENMDAETFEKLYKDMLDVVAVKLQTSPEEVQQELINFM